MAKTFIATYSYYMGSGLTLLEAYESLKDDCGEDCPYEECDFYEAEKVEVEVKIVKKEVISKIAQKKTCERN